VVSVILVPSLSSNLKCHQEAKEIHMAKVELTGLCEKLSSFYLKQSISMAIQKGNAVCVRGCPQKTSLGLEGLFNFHVQETEML